MPHITATVTKNAIRWRSNASFSLMFVFTQYKTSPVVTGASVGLASPNKAPSAPKLKYATL